MPSLANDPPDWDAIARYRSGESVGDEARRVAAWLDANPADADLLEALDAIVAPALGAGAPTAGEPDVEAALRAVRTRMRGDDEARVIPLPSARAAREIRAPRRGGRWIPAGLAAAAAIVAVAVAVGRTRGTAPDDGAMRPGEVAVTATGVRDSVRLPDGTRAILAPATRLTVSPAYGGAAREVTVDGAVWLSVRHDPARPFVVHTATATLRDLGTEFTVRTGGANGPRGLAVAVTEGVVQLDPVDPAASSYTLRAGDRAVVADGGAVITTRGGAGEADTAWVRGRLVFRDAPLGVVRDDLRRWYGIDLRVADSSLLARRLTATFEGESADRVLDVIALALGARMERRDSVAVLRGAPVR